MSFVEALLRTGVLFGTIAIVVLAGFTVEWAMKNIRKRWWAIVSVVSALWVGIATLAYIVDQTRLK